MKKAPLYYVPEKTYWPIIGSFGLFFIVLGIVNILHASNYGWGLFLLGSLLLAYMMFAWFSGVIHESQQGLYSAKLDRSFRYGMAWFIFSEVCFFAAFFAVLFYARVFSVPWLGGEGDKGVSHLLWENFKATWPLLNNPDPSKYPSPLGFIPTWGIPAFNTLILLSSGATITIAHYALKNGKRVRLIIGLMMTIVLGITFLILQSYEYFHAYSELKLKLNTGIYASTFFLLTGFHGAHVTLGTIILIVILLRALAKQLSPEKHFGFDAAAWYWHFVDVIWLLLFIFVYWL